MGHKQATIDPATALPQGQGQPFYQKLEEFLVQHDFDRFVEERCRKFYAKKTQGRWLPWWYTREIVATARVFR
jgi:hypothetical protein